MIEYPKFVAYKLWTQQNHKCGLCSVDLHGQEVSSENIVNDVLACNDCATDTPTGSAGKVEDYGSTLVDVD